MQIEYYEDDFEICEEKTIGHQDYRIIKYSTDYYALQYKFVSEEHWRNFVLSPHPYTKRILKSDNGSFFGGFESFLGKADLHFILEDIEDAYKLQQGEYYNLVVYLNYEDKFCDIIKREDGRCLLEKINECNDASMNYYYNVHELEKKYDWIIFLLLFGYVVLFVFLMLFVFK